MSAALARGLYDQVVNEELKSRIASTSGTDQTLEEQLDGPAVTSRLSDLFGQELHTLLSDAEPESTDDLVRIWNELLVTARRLVKADARKQTNDMFISAPPRLLKSVSSHGDSVTGPETGLADPWLFTAARTEPQLFHELRKEIATADEIDLLMSFITWSGVRKLEDVFRSATAINADGKPATRIRILTTTYIGATEQRALEFLTALPGVEIKISMDGRRSRLHAKSWLFRRNTEFGSAYVGSANLTGAALLGGHEWTVKFTQAGQRPLFEAANAHFETLWNDPEFEKLDPQDKPQWERLGNALRIAKGSAKDGAEDIPQGMVLFTLEPKEYQRAMLETLWREREQGRTKNLVVAATGTGKTVVAAFDYKSICEKEGGRPRLLFIAHRKEILTQAVATYRQVLRQPDFGELLFDGHIPTSNDHLFAAIQSLTSGKLVQTLGSNFWNTVVVDECHHLPAESFSQLVATLRPKYLVGLTATPERMDGKSLMAFFDARPDGRPSVELRLWDALEAQLLCPFEYYGINDENTDLTGVQFGTQSEASDLARVLSADHARAHLVIAEYARLSGTPHKYRALAFCAGVEHAIFMADQFTRAGLKSIAIHGGTDPEIRRKAPKRLASGELNVITTCEVYNEGIDIPEADVLLFLRPTQSPVIVQQQLGRGLRLLHDKPSCLVLDFVGRHNETFRFDRFFNALTGLSRRAIREQVEQGFSHVPAGCSINLQKQVQDRVLFNLKALTNQRWDRLASELALYASTHGGVAVKLDAFLHDQEIELEDIYRDNTVSGWTALKRKAGLIISEAAPDEADLNRRFAWLLHVDDPRRFDVVQRIACGDIEAATNLAEIERQLCMMVSCQLLDWSKTEDELQQVFTRINNHPLLADELDQLVSILRNREAWASTATVNGMPSNWPFALHASYQIREIIVGCGHRGFMQAGVLRLPAHQREVLFITLDKSKHFNASTAYKDYAISPDRFHWETPNNTAPSTEAGRRYAGAPQNGWQFMMFVRENRDSAYTNLGMTIPISVAGSRPMSIVLQLLQPMPTELFQRFSVHRPGAVS